jgi:rRNA processing protein Gar1
MQTTWTTNGRKHIATVNGVQIGRITEMLAKTDEPFLAVSENGMVKQFLILYHAKDWIENSAIDFIEALEALDD